MLWIFIILLDIANILLIDVVNIIANIEYWILNIEFIIPSVSDYDGTIAYFKSTQLRWQMVKNGEINISRTISKYSQDNNIIILRNGTSCPMKKSTLIRVACVSSHDPSTIIPRWRIPRKDFCINIAVRWKERCYLMFKDNNKK